MRSEQPAELSGPTKGDLLAPWLLRWGLKPDGQPSATHSSHLLPVLFNGSPAMLKVALITEEERGSHQLAWWNGTGTARVFALEGPAVLMERAQGTGSLADMARSGRDTEASSILCRVAALLHAPRPRPSLQLVPLHAWFEPLLQAPGSHGADFAMAARIAEKLLRSSSNEVPLHGDLHHMNVLDFGDGDWRAIDPKGLRGERTFDLIHMLRNPDCVAALSPGRLKNRAEQIAAEASVEAKRLLEWAIAFAGLSGIWANEDGDDPQADILLIRQAAALLPAE